MLYEASVKNGWCFFYGMGAYVPGERGVPTGGRVSQAENDIRKWLDRSDQ